jgi:hypothetical protein
MQSAPVLGTSAAKQRPAQENSTYYVGTFPSV